MDAPGAGRTIAPPRKLLNKLPVVLASKPTGRQSARRPLAKPRRRKVDESGRKAGWPLIRMNADASLYLIAGAIVVSALALILQALLIVGVYKSLMAIRNQVTALGGHVKPFVESAQRTFEQSRNQISEVATKTSAVLDLAHKQLVRIDDVLGEATTRAKVQMDRVELILDETLSRLHETTALLHKGVLRPVREITAVAAGIHAALGYLFRSQRTSVEQATQDEEMFI